MPQKDKPVNILIVDDNKNNLLSLHSLIDEYFDNVTVYEAESGLNALSFIMKNRVDLIILDIQMPQMDGFETAKIIQSRSKTRHIPIVFLTAAYKSEEFRKKGYDAGAADYLTKPIEPHQLTNKLKTYLRFIQQGQQPTQGEIKQAAKEDSAKLSQTNESLQKVMDELHSSLAVILNSSKVLKENAKKYGQKESLSEIEKIAKESQQLLDLVNNVLEPKLMREMCLLMSK